MVYKKAKQRVRKAYSHGKSILGSNIFKNPVVVGLLAGAAKNAATGKKIIDIESIKTRVSKTDGSNPLIFLLLGIAMRSSALTAIGAYAVIDPPDAQKKEEYTEYSNTGENQEPVEYSNIGGNEETVEYSNIGENEETVEYSNIGENEEKEATKRKCVH